MQGVLDHFFVQYGPPQTKALPQRKTCIDFSALSYKPNSAERKSLCRIDGDAEILKSGKSIRHQAFSAGLVDRRLCPIGHYNVKALPARGDCSGKPSRPPADHKHVCCSPHLSPRLSQVSRTSRITRASF
jgi:hypothetical protein